VTAALIDRVLEASVVLSFTKVGYGLRRRLFDWRDLDDLDLTGRTVLVTGANSGLGYAAAEQLARMGASLHLLVRDRDKGEDTLRRIGAATGHDDLSFDVADLADLDSVRRFAERFLATHDRLDVLLHNAGAMFSQRRETPEGIETTFAVHVVGPFLLTAALLPALQTAAPSRVVWMSSGGMYTEKLDVDRVESPNDYRPAAAYARAKRAQVVLAEQWTQRLGGRGVRFDTLHPGWADTPGVRRSLPGFHKLTGPLLRSPEQGADTAAWLAAAPEVDDAPSGSFWLDRQPRSKHKVPLTRADDDEAGRLWAHVVARAGGDPTAVSPTASAARRG
jgi:dehydrogenase/reductase SDR family member 12